MNLKYDWRFSDFNMPYSRKAWCGECLANLLFLSIWQKKLWRMNRSAKRLLNVSTNLNGFSLGITGDYLNFPAIQYVKL